MRIILTGCSGFLGGALAKHWADAHELYRIEGRKDFSSKMAQAPDADWLVHCGFEVSFRPDQAAVERNMASANAVAKFLSAGKARQLLFVSAAGVMGVNQVPVPLDEQAVGSTSPGFEAYRDSAYIQAKLRVEELFRSEGIKLTVVYPTTIFGPGMPSETLNALRSGKICPPGGTSYIALQDLLAAMDKVLQADASGERYILNAENILFSDLFACARASEERKSFIRLPAFLRPLLHAGKFLPNSSFLSLAVLESAFGFKYYSAEKAQRKFSWQPSLSCLEALASAKK